MDAFEQYIEKAIDWAKRNTSSTEYRFRCLAFVEDAYEKGNGIEMFGGDCATESADLYGPLGTGVPEKGAFVFYHATGTLFGITKDWGHVGISIGDGLIIHTWDAIRTDHYLAVETLRGADGWTPPEYRGWAGPGVFLKGYRVL